MATILEELTKYRGKLTTILAENNEAYYAAIKAAEDAGGVVFMTHSGDDYIAPNRDALNAYRLAVKTKDWDKVRRFEESWTSLDSLKAKASRGRLDYEEMVKAQHPEAWENPLTGVIWPSRKFPHNSLGSSWEDAAKKLTESAKSHDLIDGINAGFIKAKKTGNATMLFYYLQLKKKLDAGTLAAFNDYDTFINSWAGQEWLKKHADVISKMAEDENSRFGFLGKTKWHSDKLNNGV